MSVCKNEPPGLGGRGAASAPRVKLPYLVSNSTNRASTLLTLICARVAAIDAGEQRLGQIIDGLLAVVIQQKFVHRTIGQRPWGGWRKNSKAIRIFADQPNSCVSNSGSILVGTIIISPSGMGINLPFLTMYVMRE